MKKMAESGYDFSNSMSKSNGFIDSIASQLFGIEKSEFFEKIKLSEESLAKMETDAKILTDALDEATNAVNKGFGNALNSARAKGVKVNESISAMTNQLSKKMPEIAKQIQDAFDSKNLANLSPEAMKQFKKIVKDKEGFEKLNKFFKSDAVKDLKNIEKELKNLQEGFQENGKEVINIGKGLNSVLERLSKGFNLKSIWESAMGFDQTIVDAQRNSGLFLASTYKASAQFAELSSNAQQFGMSMKDTTELMGTLGSTLRTTDVGRLSEAAGSMAAIKNATGLAVNEVGELGGQMMLMGKSAKDVSKFAESTMKSASNFGVNGRKVMQDILKNIPKFRQMGFQGGEESLKKMALQAERLGQNIDEIFDMSKRARNIEGALDMASQLQLAGGSFSNVNPMDLLAAARKGPQELQKILGQMGSDIGKFDKTTGQMAFDAVDYDRLQMVADATGMSVDSLQKQITTMNQDAQKTELIPPGLFDSLDDEQKSFLLNNIGKNGKISMSGGIDGITDLNSLTKDNIKTQLETQAKEKGTLEEQAKQNTSFTESIANLKGAIMNLFVFFEPFIKTLTSLIQKISGMPIGFKIAFAALLAGLALVFSAGKQVFNGMMFRKGFDKGGTPSAGGIKEMLGFGKGKNAVGATTGAASGTTDLASKAKGPKAGIGAGLSSLAKGLGKMGTTPGVFKGLLAVALAGPAFLLFIPALPGLLVMALIGAMSPLIIAGFSGISMGLGLLGKNLANIAKGALALALIGLSFIPLAFALTLFAGLSWETLGIAAVAIVGAALLLVGLGFVAPFILMGALALAAAGVALLVFGASMLVVSKGFESITKIDWSALSAMGPALLTIAAAGALGLVGTFGLIGMSFALGALATVMVVLAPAMQMAAQSTNSMAEGIGKLKEAVKGLDVEKLNSMADAAERLSTASAIGGLANAVSGMFGGGDKGSKEQKIKIEPITINLKMNGRMIQTEIIDANALTT
jgi:hypothetical protein